jgi:hypothetical protein
LIKLSEPHHDDTSRKRFLWLRAQPTNERTRPAGFDWRRSLLNEAGAILLSFAARMARGKRDGRAQTALAINRDNEIR